MLKRTLLAVSLLLAPLAAYAVPFTCQLNAVGTSLTECQALTTGKRISVQQIIVNSTTTTGAGFSLQYGTGTNCGSGTGALFPSTNTIHRFSYSPSTSGPTIINFLIPLMVPVSNALCVVTSSVTNTAQIYIAGDIS